MKTTIYNTSNIHSPIKTGYDMGKNYLLDWDGEKFREKKPYKKREKKHERTNRK